MGPSPIGFRDIAAFQDLTGFRFAPWEVEMIERLDDLWCAEAARGAAAPAEGGDA